MKELMKRITKDTPFYHPLRNILRNYIEKKRVIEWEKNGKPVPPPHSIKQQAIRDYAKNYGIKILVETGTLHGDMIEAMRKDFDHLYSIELDEKLYKDAQKRFSGINHIEIIHGDSGVQLEFLLKNITQPALFWLDGHYSGGVTAKGEKSCPIYAELHYILVTSNYGHVIIIDDACCFGSDPDYPNMEELSNFVKAKNPNLAIVVQDNIIRITPQQ
jgi:hypothetical protein